MTSRSKDRVFLGLLWLAIALCCVVSWGMMTGPNSKYGPWHTLEVMDSYIRAVLPDAHEERSSSPDNSTPNRTTIGQVMIKTGWIDICAYTKTPEGIEFIRASDGVTIFHKGDYALRVFSK